MSFATLKERHRAEKRGHIEAAAARVFAGVGYAEATVAQVARAAGLSPAAIYLYFDSKDELLFAAALSEIAELERRMTRALEDEPPPAQALRRMVDAYYAFYRERPQGFAMLVAGLNRPARMKAPPEAVANHDRAALRSLELLHDVVARGMRDGSLREGDAWELTHAIWGTFHGILQLADSQPDRERFVGHDVRSLLERATESLLHGIEREGT